MTEKAHELHLDDVATEIEEARSILLAAIRIMEPLGWEMVREDVDAVRAVVGAVYRNLHDIERACLEAGDAARISVRAAAECPSLASSRSRRVSGDPSRYHDDRQA